MTPPPVEPAEPLLRKFQKELSAGTVSLALLGVLAAAPEPMYGYQIAKRLEQVGVRTAELRGPGEGLGQPGSEHVLEGAEGCPQSAPAVRGVGVVRVGPGLQAHLPARRFRVGAPHPEQRAEQTTLSLRHSRQ